MLRSSRSYLFYKRSALGKIVNLSYHLSIAWFFLCSFRVLLALGEEMVEVWLMVDVHRNFLMIFLLLLNILIRNLFLLRYFCAVCLCYAYILECLLWSMVFPAHVETLLFNNFLYTTKLKRMCCLSFTNKSADWS